jgi:uncharacterized phage-associated protein
MPHRSVEIANEFLGLSRGNLTQMQIQKLAYMSHGWNLAINDEPLIGEPARAWPYGPVYPDLYDHTKYFGKEPIGRLITDDDSVIGRFFGEDSEKSEPFKADLSPREKAVIEHVWRRYGSLGAIRLSELTHQPGTPWFNAFRNGGQGTVLPDDEIKQHYLDLARRARDGARQTA